MKRPSKREIIREDQPIKPIDPMLVELASDIRRGPLLHATDRPYGSLGYTPHWVTPPNKTLLAGVLHGTGLSFYFEFHNERQAREIELLRQAMSVAPRVETFKQHRDPFA